MPRGRLFHLDWASVADRCDELLAALYTTAISRPAGTVKPEQEPGIVRVLRRLGASPEDLAAVTGLGKADGAGATSLRFLSNAARHGSSHCTPRSPRCSACPLISFCQAGINHARRSTGDALLAIDVFAGAGSLSAAFRREGFRVALAVERDRHAAQTYRFNNRGVPVIEADVRRVSARELLAAAGCKKRDVTVVISGPPCQGFSAAGRRKPHASQNFLYRYLADLSKGIGAGVVVMENVPGLKSVNGVCFEHRIVNHFRSRGYNAESFEVDAAEFGVPQRRKRMLFLGLHARLGLTPRRPVPLAQRGNRTVEMALRGLPALRAGAGADVLQRNGRLIYNHRAMAHGTGVIRKIRKIGPGQGPISYRRLERGMARTLIAGHRAMPVHPRQHRTITVREAARIQTLPDGFRFLGPHSEQPLQVANVVPFQLGRAIARTLMHALRRPEAR